MTGIPPPSYPEGRTLSPLASLLLGFCRDHANLRYPFKQLNLKDQPLLFLESPS